MAKRYWRRGEWNQCGRKHGYASRVTAGRVANRINAEENGDVVVIYKCPWCQRWHVGHRLPNDNT